MIRLLDIDIENFMNIQKCSLDFGHDIFLLSGKSASGKSAVFDAVSLCLTSKKRSTSYSEYVRQGCTHSKILLNILVNNEPVSFNLQINLVRGTPYQMELTYKNQIYRNTEADIIKKAFDLEYYSDIIFSMQNDLYGDITQLGPAHRAIYLQRLLNFDFQKEKDIINENLVSFRAQNTKIINDISLREQLISREQKSLEEEIKILLTENDVNKFNKQIAEKQKKITLYQSLQEEISKLNEQYSNASNNMLNFNLRKNEIANKLKQIQEKKDLFKNTENKLIEVNVEISGLEEKIKSLLLKMKSNEEEYYDKHSKKINLEREIKLFEDNIGQYEQYAALEKQDKCPLCKQDLKEHLEKELKNAMMRYDNIYDGQYNSFSEKLDSLKEKLSIKENEYSEIKLFLELSKTTNNNDERNNIIYNTKIEQLKTERIDLENKVKTLEDNFDESLDLHEELKTLTTNIDNERTLLENIQKDIQEKSKNEDISALSAEIVSITSKISQYHNDIKLNDEIKARNLKKNNNITDYTNEITKFNTELKDVTSKLNTYEDAHQILDKTLPNYMIVKTCASLQNEMNNFIQSIFPNYEVKLINNKKGCEFFYTQNKSIVEDTKKRNNAWINSKMSSGFEKALLTISFKCALAVLYGINILLLDEICSSADLEASIILFDNIINKFDQLFIISHKDDLKSHLLENYQNIVKYDVSHGKFNLSLD